MRWETGEPSTSHIMAEYELYIYGYLCVQAIKLNIIHNIGIEA